MGSTNRQEAWLLRWAELLADPVVQSITGKVELNGMGVIEVSPALNRHSRMQTAIVLALGGQLKGGEVIVECSVLTSDGVRVPDVVWVSDERMEGYDDLGPMLRAPDICIEVRSRSNTDAEMEHKTALYLEAGAVEVWIVTDAGARTVFDASGAKGDVSRYPVVLAPPRA